MVTFLHRFLIILAYSPVMFMISLSIVLVTLPIN